LKLCTRDYVGEATHQANFGSNWYSGGFSEILPLCDFLTVLSCPFFFSETSRGRTDEPIFTLYGSNLGAVDIIRTAYYIYRPELMKPISAVLDVSHFRNIWQKYYRESKQSKDAIFSTSPN